MVKWNHIDLTFAKRYTVEISNFRQRNKMTIVPRGAQDCSEDSGTLFCGLFSEEGVIRKSDDDDDDDDEFIVFKTYFEDL